MRDRAMSALSLVAIALEEAEDALRRLPYTTRTRSSWAACSRRRRW